MLDKDQEKMALKALLKSLMKSESESEEEVGDFVEERRETSVTPEEVEGEVYDEEEGLYEDSEDSLEDEDEDEGTERTLKELVREYMNESEDPFEGKKALGVVGVEEPDVEIEISREQVLPLRKPLGMKGVKMKKRKR